MDYDNRGQYPSLNTYRVRLATRDDEVLVDAHRERIEGEHFLLQRMRPDLEWSTVYWCRVVDVYDMVVLGDARERQELKRLREAVADLTAQNELMQRTAEKAFAREEREKIRSRLRTGSEPAPETVPF